MSAPRILPWALTLHGSPPVDQACLGGGSSSSSAWPDNAAGAASTHQVGAALDPWPASTHQAVAAAAVSGRAPARVIGWVQHWIHGRGGALIYCPQEGVERRVTCTPEAYPCTAPLVCGDLVEFSVRESALEEFPVAEDVLALLGKNAEAAGLAVLESARWPASELEAAPGEDAELCARCLAELRATVAAPPRLKAAAEEYLQVLQRFRTGQESKVQAEWRHEAGGQAEEEGAPLREASALAQAWGDRAPSAAELRRLHVQLRPGPATQQRQFAEALELFVSKTDVDLGLQVSHAGDRARRQADSEVMEAFAAALEGVLLREDLAPHTKAAWAACSLLLLRPFPSGSGALALFLANWVLRSCGVPFPIVLCKSHEQRCAWHDSITGGQKGRGSPQVLASAFAAEVARAWRDVEVSADSTCSSRREETDDRVMRVVRERTRDGTVCAVCLESPPNMLALCCGAAFHMACMSRWLGSCSVEPMCPACRAPVVFHTEQPPQPLDGGVYGISELRAVAGAGLRALSSDAASVAELRAIAEAGLRALDEDIMPPFIASTVQGICAFCPNMRATGCALCACARCCEANQRMYGVRCLRHPTDSGSNLSVSSSSDDDWGLDESVEDDRCTFCNNRRAADCALGACRSCCLSRPERCPRHGPSLQRLASGPGPPRGLVDALAESPHDPRTAQALGEADFREFLAPATVDFRDFFSAEPVPRLPSRPSGSSMSSGVSCAFCSNRRATGCRINACRSCCARRCQERCERHSGGTIRGEEDFSEWLSGPSAPPSLEPPNEWLLGAPPEPQYQRQRAPRSDPRTRGGAPFRRSSPPVGLVLTASPEALAQPVMDITPPSAGLQAVLAGWRPPASHEDAATGSSCSFCENRRAMGCMQQACGRCCLFTRRPCQRHRPAGAYEQSA